MSPHYGHRGTGVMLIVSHSLDSPSLRIFYSARRRRRRKEKIIFPAWKRLLSWFFEFFENSFENKWTGKGKRFDFLCAVKDKLLRDEIGRGGVFISWTRSRFLDREWSTAGDKVVKSRFDARNFLPITDFDAPPPRYSAEQTLCHCSLSAKKIQYVFCRVHSPPYKIPTNRVDQTLIEKSFACQPRGK